MQTLPRLKSLTVDLSYGGDIHQQGGALFFQPLNMPALAKLTLITDGYEAYEMPLFIPYLFSRSGPSLRSLVLEYVHFDRGEIIQLLRLLPVLEHFACKFGFIGNDELWEALRYDGVHGPAPLAPQLESLTLLEYSGLGHRLYNTLQKIVGMIASRWWSNEDLVVVPPAVARWKNIRVMWEDFDGRFEEDDEGLKKSLAVFRDQGLNVKVANY